MPEQPEDLTNLNCLTLRSQPGYNIWRFRVGDDTVKIRASGSFMSDSGNSLVIGARNAMGLIMLPEWLVLPALASGDLVEVLPTFSTELNRLSLFAVHPYQRFVPPKVKTFVDFLMARFNKHYDWALSK